VAQALARRGDYLTASRYWEAALFSGAAERRVLPPLIVCEVRAGRLRAALANVRRLAVIAPEHPAVEELETLISGALASGPGSPRDEVRR